MILIKSYDEFSVCMTDNVPPNTIERKDGWKGFRIQGVLEFSLIGILLKIASLLTDNNIVIFAIFTFNTDYIFTKTENYEKAMCVLEEVGYAVE